MRHSKFLSGPPRRVRVRVRDTDKDKDRVRVRVEVRVRVSLVRSLFDSIQFDFRDRYVES